jgi:hypothetical protein
MVSEKIPGNERRENHLHQSAPGSVDETPEYKKEQMAGLVNYEVGVVNKSVTASVKAKINAYGKKEKSRNPFFQ